MCSAATPNSGLYGGRHFCYVLLYQDNLHCCEDFTTRTVKHCVNFYLCDTRLRVVKVDEGKVAESIKEFKDIPNLPRQDAMDKDSILQEIRDDLANDFKNFSWSELLYKRDES